MKFSNLFLFFSVIELASTAWGIREILFAEGWQFYNGIGLTVVAPFVMLLSLYVSLLYRREGR